MPEIPMTSSSKPACFFSGPRIANGGRVTGAIVVPFICPLLNVATFSWNSSASPSMKDLLSLLGVPTVYSEECSRRNGVACFCLAILGDAMY